MNGYSTSGTQTQQHRIGITSLWSLKYLHINHNSQTSP